MLTVFFLWALSGSVLLDPRSEICEGETVVKDDAGAGLQHDDRQLARLVLGRGPQSRPLVVPRLCPWSRPLRIRGPSGGRGRGLWGTGG